MACFASVSALGAVLTLAALGDEPVKIGTEAPFPPYLVVTDAGALDGFEYQLLQEVCLRENWTCDWAQVTFDELIPGVMDGRFDIVLGGMAITDERLERVDFSIPYHDADDTEWFVGKPGAPVPEQAMISVQAGTLHADYLRKNGLDHRSHSTETATLLAVIEDQADLAFGPFENRPDLEALLGGAGLELLYDVHVSDEGTAMAVCKGNEALLARLNTTLQAMLADGTIAEIESRWF